MTYTVDLGSCGGGRSYWGREEAESRGQGRRSYPAPTTTGPRAAPARLSPSQRERRPADRLPTRSTALARGRRPHVASPARVAIGNAAAGRLRKTVDVEAEGAGHDRDGLGPLRIRIARAVIRRPLDLLSPFRYVRWHADCDSGGALLRHGHG